MIKGTIAGAVAGAVALASLVMAAPAQADIPIAYPISDLAAAFLTDADIKALAQWGSFQPTTPAGTECSTYMKGGYVCLRDYPLHQFGSRPYSLRLLSLPTPEQAAREFALAQADALRGSESTISSSATAFSGVRREYPGTPYRIVKSGQLVGNHYIEASCWGAADRYRVEDINTCTQLMIGAQAQRLTSLVSPRVEPPAAPTDVLVDVKKGRITVTWLSPTNGGGAPITAYRATSTSGDVTCTSDPTAATVQACVINGAKAGVTYAFTVTATNSAGQGPPSEASRPAGFTTIPGRPLTPRLSLQGNEVTVRWKPPRERGGLPITRYLVQDNRGDTVCSAVQAECAVQGLSYASRYRFSVVAVNARGEGPRQWTAWIRTPQAPATSPTPAPSPETKPEQSLT